MNETTRVLIWAAIAYPIGSLLGSLLFYFVLRPWLERHFS